MARVLWLGDAGCHTGFARVTHAIGDRLVREHGHEVSVLATNYDGDYWPTPMRLYRPNKLSGLDIYGQGRIVEMLAEVMPEVVVILNDPVPIMKFLFDNQKDPTRALLTGGPMQAPILAYIPIDGHSYPPITRLLGRVTQRIAMTDYGATQMPQEHWVDSDGVSRSGPETKVVYHGVDSELYRPVSVSSPMIKSDGTIITSKRDAKASFGYDPDSILILRVDRNSHRKNYADSWKALVPVMKRHSDIIVHFHCVAVRDEYNLRELVSREPEIAKRIRFPDGTTTYRGWPEEDLAVLYNAADIFLSTSWGEGFGLGIAEAMSSGVPVIAQDASAMTEVVGPGGRLVPPLREITAPQGHEQWLPDVPAFTEAIERLYLGPGSRRKLGDAARKHILDHYSWDAAARSFDSIIGEVIDQRRQPSASDDPESNPDPEGQVQHRDPGDDGEGLGRRSPDPALHGLVHA